MAKFSSENLKGRAYLRPWIYNITIDIKEMSVDEVNPVQDTAQQKAHSCTHLLPWNLTEISGVPHAPAALLPVQFLLGAHDSIFSSSNHCKQVEKKISCPYRD